MGQGTQTLDLRLAREVQLCGVLNTENHRMLSSPNLYGLDVRKKYPLGRNLLVAEEPISRLRFRPTLTRSRNALLGPLGELTQQNTRPTIQTFIPQIGSA
jgi:hypothetical protein